jgi:hypothetical protein
MNENEQALKEIENKIDTITRITEEIMSSIWNAAIEAAAKCVDSHNNESSWPIESDEIRKLKK